MNSERASDPAERLWVIRADGIPNVESYFRKKVFLRNSRSHVHTMMFSAMLLASGLLISGSVPDERSSTSGLYETTAMEYYFPAISTSALVVTSAVLLIIGPSLS